MRRVVVLCTLTLSLLAGCAPNGTSIPAGLDWRAQALWEGDDPLPTAASDEIAGGEEIPPLDVTAQVEDGTIVLTDHSAGKTWSGNLGPGEPDGNGTLIFPLTFPDQSDCYAVYGITEYCDGHQDAALYLVSADGWSLQLSAPLEAE